MKLIDLTCPHCGAHLKVDERLTHATCEYCGASLLIDRETLDVRIVNAEEAGYDFERGRMRARAKRYGVIAVAAVLTILAILLIVALCSRGGEEETTVPAGPTPASDPATAPATEPGPGSDIVTYPESAPGMQPSPLYVHVRTSTTADGGIMWHFTFSNHGIRDISQIIIAWAAYDADGKLLDNPTTAFNLFEKGWNITGNPLEPGYALDEVTVSDIVFTNPQYGYTTLMMVAIRYADGEREQLILDGTYYDVSNVPTDLGYVKPGL